MHYTPTQLKNKVSSVISGIKTSIGFSSFSTMKADSRPLLDKSGIYSDFYGVTAAGASVYGRVHTVSIDKAVYTVTVVCPRGCRSTRKESVYGKIRSRHDDCAITQ